MNVQNYWQILASYNYIDLIRAAAIVSISFVILFFVRRIVLIRLEHYSERTKNQIDDLIVDSLRVLGWPVYATIGIYLASKILSLPDTIQNSIDAVTLITITVYAIQILQKIVIFIIGVSTGRDTHQSGGLVLNVLNIGLWLVALMLILQNLGFDITSIVTSLGIGGIAIAFALQSILDDFFASISIYFDKPFKNGDLVQVGNDLGFVKKVGLKSSRIKLLQGEELVISNKELTGTRIRNYRRMTERRVMFQVGVEYGTDPKKLRKIPKIIEQIIGEFEIARFDRSHFFKFADYSLIYETVYYVASNSYSTYMDIQQGINLGILEVFAKEDIKIAFPTQNVHLFNHTDLTN